MLDHRNLAGVQSAAQLGVRAHNSCYALLLAAVEEQHINLYALWSLVSTNPTRQHVGYRKRGDRSQRKRFTLSFSAFSPSPGLFRRDRCQQICGILQIPVIAR